LFCGLSDRRVHGQCLRPIIGPIERLLYRIAGVDQEVEQKWYEYAISTVAFGGACLMGFYALPRLQAYLPLNPQAFPGVPPDLAFNIAVSFITNANCRPTVARRPSAIFRRWWA
jgi:K+-transporting ATPase ATPase A chain